MKQDTLNDIIYIIAGVTLTLGLLGIAEAKDKHPGPVYEPRPRAVAESYPADNWGGWKAHVAYSGAIGAGVYALFPDVHPLILGAACLLPGHVRENSRQHEPGNRYSERDMFWNLVGCTSGIGVAHGVRVHFAPNWVGVQWVFK
jgi:hypothetical protein